jgi:hypothetical protein
MFFNEILWKKRRSESFVGSLLSNSVFYLCSINNWFVIFSSIYGISLVQYSACVSIYIKREVVWKLQIGWKSRYRFDFTGNTKNSTVIKSPLPFTLILHMRRRSYLTQSLCTWSVLLPWRMYWCVSRMLLACSWTGVDACRRRHCDADISTSVYVLFSHTSSASCN